MKINASLALVLLLAACATEGPVSSAEPTPLAGAEASLDADIAANTEAGPDPEAPAAETAVAEAAPPAPSARTVEEFDTTTPEARAAAVVPAPAPTTGDGRLGTTVASLGAAGEPGFWIKTPLVSARAPGRLFYAASGRNVQVQLIPSGGARGSGSQVSLAAMRLLDAPIDALPELVVYAN